MGKNVLVFGSYVVDIMSRSLHLPIPGETVKGTAFRMGHGGKGFNQAAAARRAGASVAFSTKVGGDDFGHAALEAIHDMGIDTTHVIVDAGGITGTALIMVDENTSQNQIVVCIGACDTISTAEVDTLVDVIPRCPILLVQLETNMNALAKVVALSRQNGALVVLNPAPAHMIPDSLYGMVDIITPNETEATALSGLPVDARSRDQLSKAAEFFVRKGIPKVIITLGAEGIYIHTEDFKGIMPPFRVDALDTTGAGDAFNGALVAAIAEGMDMVSAARFAQAAAALCVTQLGSSNAMPARKDIEALLRHTNIPV